MSGIFDRVKAMGAGAAQGATGGWGDEGVAKILAALPQQDDGTGIPREYAGGQEAQYLASERGDNAEAQRRFPASFGTGQVLGAAPAAIATGASVPGAVALGALGGAGSADDGSRLNGALKGGALGGALGAAGRALPAAGAALRDIDMPMPPSGMQPATAGANPVAPRRIPSQNQNMNFRSDVPGDEAATSNALKSSADETSVNQARQSVEPDAFDNMNTFPPLSSVDDLANIPIPRQKPLTTEKMTITHPRTGNTTELDNPVALQPQTEQSLAATVRPTRPKGGSPHEGAAAVEAAMARRAALQEAKAAKLGEGWSREVYEDSGNALKLAKKPAGIIQNQTEVELAGKSPYLNPILEHAPDYSWVRQPKVNPFEYPDDMAKHLGLEGADEEWLRRAVNNQYPSNMPPAAQEFQKRLAAVQKDVPELDPRDLGKAAQWGRDADGNVVLLDYGFRRGAASSVAGLGLAAGERE